MREINFPNPVSLEEDFFGKKRRKELEYITQKFESKNRLPLIILGERRIGKTSLQNVVLNRLLQFSGHSVIPLKVEPRGLKSLDELAQAALQHLATHLRKDIRDSMTVKDSGKVHLETPDMFETAFENLLGPNSKDYFLLCIDEFDEIIRTLSADELARVMGLLSWLSEKTNQPIGIFFTMTRLPESMQNSFPTPFINVAEITELTLFDKEDTFELLQDLTKDQIVINEDDMSWIYRMSGGHPYFIKLILVHLIQEQSFATSDSAISSNVLDKILSASCRDPRAKAAVENLYRVQFSNDEKRIILLLTQTQRLIKSLEIQNASVSFLTAARNLVRRGYLVETDGSYDLQIPFLGEWLRAWDEFDEELERLEVRVILDPWAGSQPTKVTEDDLYNHGLVDD